MEFKKILLINPSYKAGHYGTFINAGVGYISQALEDAGIEHYFIDLNFAPSLRKVYQCIQKKRIDLVGISMMTQNYLNTYQVISRIKAKFPSIKIIVGGPHASALNKKLLEQCSAIDYVIQYEGERSMVQLCKSGDPWEVPSLVFRQGEEIVMNEQAKFINDLDSIPFPQYKKFDLCRYPGRSMPIVSSRGCPYGCIYCPIRLSMGRKFRARSAEHVVDEIEFWYKRGKRRFGIADDCFTFDRNRVVQICDEIRKRNIKDLMLNCSNGIRADRVDRELLTIMREVGFFDLSFGIESCNDRVLKNLKKGEDVVTLSRAVQDACDLGYDVGLFFLIGSPGETPADLENSIQFALRYPIARVSFYHLIPFPGTELHEWVHKNNYLVRPESEYLNDIPHWLNKPIFYTPEFSYNDRKKCFIITRQIMIKIKKKFVRRKLKNFGIIRDLVAYILTLPFVEKQFNYNRFLRGFARYWYTTILKAEKNKHT